MLRLIYETKGRAREFSELALNHYIGCGHGCLYCYGPNALHISRKDFHERILPRSREAQIEIEARDLEAQREKRPILLSFVTDPYNPVDFGYNLTHKVIYILKKHKLALTILTKAGDRAMRDIGLLEPGIDTFATTLTCCNSETSRYWEPHAGLPLERIQNLRGAKARGLKTWVSCEPVINPHDTISWSEFAERIKELQPRVNRPFYLKKDLAKYLGHKEGIWIGEEAKVEYRYKVNRNKDVNEDEKLDQTYQAYGSLSGSLRMGKQIRYL